MVCWIGFTFPTTRMTSCPICGRDKGGEMQSHHLLPRTFRTRTTSVHDKENRVDIHKVCHQKIHATFSEQELFQYYHTVERIREHDEMQKFIKWVRKKPADFYNKNNETQSRKRKR